MMIVRESVLSVKDCGCKSAAGIYIARCITKCNYNQNGRQNPCPCKEGIASFAQHQLLWFFPEFRNGGTGTGGTSKRRIFSPIRR